MIRTLLTVLFLTVLSTPVFGEWKMVYLKGVDYVESLGDLQFVGFDRIKQKGGAVYFWKRTDYMRPVSGRFLSDVTYN